MEHPPAPPRVNQSTPVSVLLPAYNAERYLEQAVRSVLEQTHRQLELLAIDDGSTDATLRILRALALEDDRVRVISHENLGMGAALNRAAVEARHDWLVRMDADDIMAPARIERQLAFLAAHPQLMVASSLVHYIDAPGKVIGHSRSEYTDAATVRRAFEQADLIGFHHPAVIMRRDAFIAIGGYRPQFWPCDDLDLWSRIVERYPDSMLVQDEHLLFYRIHDSSVCVTSSQKVCRRMEWVETCVKRRRAGLSEPTLEEFETAVASAPLLTRLDRMRRDRARTSYKAAAMYFSNRQLTRFFPSLCVASVLEPGYVLNRIAPYIRRFRSVREMVEVFRA